MGRETISVRVDDHHKERIAELQDRYGEDTPSAVIRRLIAEEQPRTLLERVARRLTDGFALATIVIVGLTFWLPLELRAITVVWPAFAAIGAHGTTVALEALEPSITTRLRGLFGGETA